MKLKWFVAGAIAAGLLQSAALGKIVFDRADLIQNGREVVLQSGMVDPRDLFRGHYVVLNLTISRLSSEDVKTVGEFEYGQEVWVSLKKGDEEFWVADTIYSQMPTSSDMPIIRGEYRSSHGITGRTQTHSIRFPVDRFFAEKERARDLEKVRRDRNLGVVVALSDNGTAAIKGISVEGELIYVESVW